LLHAALLVGLLLWFHREPTVGEDSQTPGTVELVMLEQQGDKAATPPPGQDAAPAPAAAKTASATPPAPPVEQPEPQAQSPPEPPAQPQVEALASAAQPPPGHAAPREPAAAAPATAPAPRSEEAPEIHITGNDDETNAVVLGPRVIPASVDAKVRNREPAYPPEAVRSAQQGAVTLLIHVTPDGLASGVDVVGSSGFALLDRSARDTVASWHFRPAMENGKAVAFDMPFRVVFRLY
jgi:periplasmic protein TonB